MAHQYDWRLIEGGLQAFMYSEFVADQRRRFRAAELQKEAAPNFPTNVVLNALDKLIDDGFIKRSTQKVKNIISVPFVDTNIILFELSRLGIESFKDTAENELQHLVSSLKSSSPGIGVASPTTEPKDPEAGSKANSSSETDGSLIGASGEPFTLGTSQLAPAADRIVQLDHNSPVYGEAVSALEQVTEEFEKDTNLDNELGPEKIGLVQILHGARELLNDYKIGLQLAIGSIVKPLERLKEIATKHEGVTWGAFVNAALNAIQKLLGIA